MNYYLYLIDYMKDILKVIDYLKSDCHFTSDCTFGGGGIEIEKTHEKILSCPGCWADSAP